MAAKRCTAKRYIIAFVGIFSLCASTAFIAQTHAQERKESPGLTEVLTDLLQGSSNFDAADDSDRRTPFGHDEIQLSFAPLVRQAAPAVVNVYASKTTRARSPFEGDPFFEQFFGRSMPRSQSSLGSGVLVDEAGFIVTNYHVIKDADEVKVAMSDGREFSSKVLLKDETLDLAVIKIEADKPFPALAIGDSDALQVGDLVLAIGNPFGVGQTTTSGIVSALARSHIGISDSSFFIQTDAAINPGNSGGGLINMRAQLVGVNTAIYSRSGGSIGIGFAIPSNMVNAFVEAAKAGQTFFERPYIGATFDVVTPQIAESLGMETPSGALVSAVESGGPSEAAGLRPGDVILRFNNTIIEGVDALGYRLATQPIGTQAELLVLSKGKEKKVDIALVRAPEGASVQQVQLRGRSPFAGAKIAELSPRLAQRLGIGSDIKGVVVVEVERNSPAGGFGLRAGDIVREVNGQTMDTTRKLVDASQQNARWWRFTLERDGQLMRQVLRY
ncbi:DegQ family serine endoprotease [Aquamicrobium segne]|uniref:DegQ family serine endoprotease n=1 Tax=Aquamicrobium segne TaxID=469547 RepID=A0ABW0GZ44_9HYPH